MSVRSATLIALGILATGLASEPALAATPTASFNVSATVAAGCQASAFPIALGSYASALANPASAVTMNCTSNAAYNVTLSGGGTSGEAVSSWRMTGLEPALAGYALPADSQGIRDWGRAASPGGLAGAGSSAAHALPVHGLIAAGQPGANGAPADTILVTITY